MIIVLYGAPGCGKGTQADAILNRYGNDVCHLSVGDVFRKLQNEDTELAAKIRSYMGKGALVPPEIVIDVVDNFMKENHAKYKYFLFDGFPRSEEQAIAFLKIVKKFDEDYVVLTIDVPDEPIVKRLTSRKSCENCGAILSGDVAACPKCGSTSFKKRADDTKDVIENRLKLYHDMYDNLVKVFDENKVFIIDGNCDINIVSESIFNLLETKVF